MLINIDININLFATKNVTFLFPLSTSSIPVGLDATVGGRGGGANMTGGIIVGSGRIAGATVVGVSGST